MQNVKVSDTLHDCGSKGTVEIQVNDPQAFLFKYIVENGITMKDPFSWHEDLYYTYPHWAYDVCTYLVYKIGGFERHICCNSNFDSCFRTNCIFYKCEIS